jgi:hypothetical protein
MYREILKELTHKQIQELLIESFGAMHAKYLTLDEIPLYKLIAKIPRVTCPVCKKGFIPNIDGGKEIKGVWYDLDCYWNSEIQAE